MKKYYHGTSYYCAYRILNEGFRIISYFGGGGVKGSGIYTTDNLEYAFGMAVCKGVNDKKYRNQPCLIECDLQLTNPIFWTKKEYDPKVINYLKKEFDKKILDPDYKVSKFIPKNKKLTKNEVINLINYWGVKQARVREKQRKKSMYFWEGKEKGDSCYLDNARFLLSRYKFSGWGQYTHDCWDSDEIVVFNPSEIIPIKVCRATGDWNKENACHENIKIEQEISLEELKLGYEEETASIKKLDEQYQDNSQTDLYK